MDHRLPISEKREQIIDAIRSHRVLIVSGDTGCGKTTQLPQYCLAAGRGTRGTIGCTQPRRIASITIAERIAEEMGEPLGKTVGYQIRFQDRTSRSTRIKIMTDGILLAETLSDPLLRRYDTLIVDEAHERSLNIDFLLGYLRNLVHKRDDLSLIITSATLDTERFSEAFDKAPIVSISGRTYPVDVRYEPAETDPDEADAEATHVERAVEQVCRLHGSGQRGDMLLFMPTEQDIRETCELITARNLRHTVVLPLFARLPASEQRRVFGSIADQKIIVATNIAETSVTIPGIRIVIDSGLARQSQYNPRTRTTSLLVKPVSQSSAEQRKGRAGRTASGLCIRLYSQEDFLSRPLYTKPEILRANLAEVILRMLCLRLGDIYDFPFIDRPEARSISDGYQVLLELGAIRRERGGGFRLTENGRIMARIPVDPRISRMLLQARQEGCIEDILIIAAALSISDPRERPAEKAGEADAVHRSFFDPLSDFSTLLNIWNRYRSASAKATPTQAERRRFCRQHFLSYRRMREWQDIYAQLDEVVTECGLKSTVPSTSEHPPIENDQDRSDRTVREDSVVSAKGKGHPKHRKTATGSTTSQESDVYGDRFSAIHRSILAGFLSNIAVRREKNVYRAARDREVMLFPGSCLFNKGAEWIVAAEMVETSRVFARIAGRIDNRWIEPMARHLCRYTYLHPHWEKNRGEVVASEQVSLFGLIVQAGRSVSYGRIDPEEAARIFVRSALIEGEIKPKFAFLEHNHSVIEAVREKENRLRRRDLLVSDADIEAFYLERIGTVSDIRSLQHLIRQKGGDDFLRMTEADVMNYEPDVDVHRLFPDVIRIGDRLLTCRYRFDPGKPEDGLTVPIPVSQVSLLPYTSLGWMVPGFFKAKIEALIRGLPKSLRKQLVPIAKTVEIIETELPRSDEDLFPVLSRFCLDRFGVSIPVEAWSESSLPDYLKTRIEVIGASGTVLSSGRSPEDIRNWKPGDIDTHTLELVRSKFERTHLKDWDFGDLADTTEVTGPLGETWLLVPALVSRRDSSCPSEPEVDLRLFTDRKEAEAHHIRGVATLYEIRFPEEFAFLRKAVRMPIGPKGRKTQEAIRFENTLLDGVVTRLFARPIRTRDAFYRHAAETFPRMIPFANELKAAMLDIEQERRKTLDILQKARKVMPANPLSDAFFEELNTRMLALLPEDYPSRYAIERLKMLPRYLRAIAVRAERATHAFDRDHIKARDLRPLETRVAACHNRLIDHPEAHVRQSTEELFWALEEYRISVFAQEIGTAGPVSRKRIEKALEELERYLKQL
ncbi:MAG: ATP-dependent RNA helicase HrpA [Thermodesulfobacteriota bacterium]